MMTDLFSSLDGCYSLYMWTPSIIAVILFFQTKTFLISINNNILMLNTFTSGAKFILPMPLFMISLMFFIIVVNLAGLTPFVFGPSSSLWFAGSMALIFWGLLIVSGIIFAPKQAAAHLAPSGAPAALVSFLILIETVSILIRPLTLTVRLIANISAGHIVLSLVANCLTSLSLSSMPLVLMVSIFYNMFEVFVCFIQAYIFTLLVSLYANEHPH
uniref:ATP synthase subunit a n=1 Tax=Pseudosuccinea columella TaxID=31228 RepID=A0A4P8Y4E8_PSECM|nr:ATP synthase F0 subunit 6 [Pseudosuccinea columella]QCT09600.1 ATP synthase F0 subunit 6 [Pseudosuccinea columella]